MFFSDLSDCRSSSLTVIPLLSFVKSLIPIFLSQSSLFALFKATLSASNFKTNYPSSPQNAKSTRIFISE